MDFLRYGIFYPFSPYCLIKKLFTIYPERLWTSLGNKKRFIPMCLRVSLGYRKTFYPDVPAVSFRI